MATNTIELPKDQWKLVSTTSVNFQVQGQANNVYIIESATMPTDLKDRKYAIPNKMYIFDKVDGDFYAYAEGDKAIISTDPKV